MSLQGFERQGDGVRRADVGRLRAGARVRRAARAAGGLVAAAGVLWFAAAPALIGAQALRWPSERPPQPLAARPVAFPPYEIRTLDNGLQVVLVSHHEQPAVSVRLIVRAGSAHDPKDRLGVAMLTAALLDQGTTSRTAEQIADEIDFVGGLLSTGAGSDLSYVDAVVMKPDLPLALDLIADIVRRPAFAPEEVERQRAQALSALRVAAEDPSAVAGRVIDRLIYGFHPYGLPGSGTPESIAALTRDDLVAFHRTWFVPNNTLVAIVGDVSADEGLAGVQRVFGDWPARPVPALRPEDPPPPTRRLVVIDKPDAVQTSIRVGQLAIPRRHADYMALEQAVRLLGGEGANRLQRVLRSERGLTYGASADLNAYKLAGGIVAETETRTEATAETLRLLVDEVARLRRDRVWPAELEGVQNYMAGHFPLTIETPNAIATQVLNALFYELPMRELETYPDRVTAIGPDDIQRVARTYIQPERLAIVLVGNAEAFVGELRGLGFADVERIPIGEVDLVAADLRRTATAPRPGAAARAASSSVAGPASRPAHDDRGSLLALPVGVAEHDDEAKARALVARAAAAHGGLAALQGVRRLIADAETTLHAADGPVRAGTRTYIEYPDHLRVDADLGGVQIVQIYAGGRAWLKDPAEVREAPADLAAEFRAGVRRDFLALLAGAAAGTYRLALEPEEGFEGRVLRVVGITGDDLPRGMRLFVDPSDGRLVKVAHRTRIDSREVETEERYGDYRLVDGLVLPFRATMVRDGRVVAERTITRVQVNPPLDPDTFARPR